MLTDYSLQEGTIDLCYVFTYETTKMLNFTQIISLLKYKHYF